MKVRDKYPTTLGSTIRCLRKKRALTLKELGSRVGLSQAYLSEIETDKKAANINTYRLIAGGLNIPYEAMIFLSMNPYNLEEPFGLWWKFYGEQINDLVQSVFLV